ncbi:MAG: response regulator transcription factor [Oscillospiraceae bacterium]
MTDILIVEDNREIGGLLRDFLKAAGYTVRFCETGEAALAAFESEGARLVVLDVMLPGMDGLAVCRKLHAQSAVPILIVSAKTAKEDKLSGLVLGADDYIEKPYDIDILLAKIAGIFQRRYDGGVLECGDLKIDKARRAVFKDGAELKMTTKEFELLLLLAENRGKVMNKELLFNRIWGFDSCSEPQTLTVHIKWLREKIEADPRHPVRIATVWGVGYRFEDGGQ